MVKVEPYIVATGMVCHQWSFLEYVFSNVIWWLLHIDKETGMIVTGGLDMLPRANMAINLAKHLNADRSIIDALVESRRKIQGGVQDSRNKIVHGVYSSNDIDEYAMIEVHRGRGYRNRTRILPEEIYKTSEEITEISETLVSELGRFGLRFD